MVMATKQAKNTDAGRESFLYQLDILKMEMQGLDTLIARLDEMAQAAKNWTITIWTGSLAISLSQPEFRRYILITAIAPLLFWYIDANFRHLQRRSIFRVQKISEFLNGPKLVESFEKNRLIDFIVMDSTSTQYRKLEEYQRFVSTRRTFRFPEVAVFYAVLTGISVAMGSFFLLVP
jgi:hypothetical protein